MTNRPSWDEYHLTIAAQVAKMGTCLRLQVGAVIVDPDTKEIISTGFNGSVHGLPHCTDVGCLINDEGRCIRTLHAEENAILHADRHRLVGATLYCTHMPCEKCSKMIAQVGIKRIVYQRHYDNPYNHHFLKDIEIVALE